MLSRDPRASGRNSLPLTSEQISARRIAIGCLILFVVCLGLCLNWHGDDIGGALVLGIVAFAFLIIGMLALGEC
jgi:hypothetical protein